MMRSTARAAMFGFLALVALASPPIFVARADTEPGTGTGRKIYKRTLESTAWIHASKSTGSGWVASTTERLVVTNYHVVGNSDQVVVVFPKYDEGKMVAEKTEYKTGIRAVVIATDPRRDMVVLQLESLPKGVKELTLAEDSASPGDTVHSIGNPGSSDALWVYTKGEVRQVYRKEMRYNGLHVRSRVVETQAPINRGDSGGPVVNGSSELIGMTAAYTVDARLISSCIDVEEIRAFLNQVKESLAEKRAWPTSPFVIRTAPLNVLSPRLKALAKQLLDKDELKKVEEVFRDWIDSDKIGPVDRARPVAGYFSAFSEKDGPTGVVLIPITDVTKARDFLTTLKVLGAADKEGIHRLKLPNEDVVVYARFAHRYAYFAFRGRALLADKLLVDPSTILPRGTTRLVSIGCRLSRMPADMRKELRASVKKERDQLEKIDPTKQDAPERFMARVGSELLRWVDLAATEGEDCWMHAAYDPRLEECSLEMTLAGKAKSSLAGALREYGNTPSLYHRVMKANPALRVLACGKLSKPLQEAISTLMDDLLPMDNPGSELFRTKFAGLMQGELDYLLEMHGPTREGFYSLIQGNSLKEGAKHLKAMQNLDPDKKLIDLNVAKIGTTAVHRGKFAENDEEGIMRRLVGKYPTHFVIGNAAGLEVTGENGLADLRGMLLASSQIGPQFLAEVSMGKLMAKPFMEEDAPPAKLAREVFKKGVADRCQVTIEGGVSLKARVVCNTAVLQFAIKAIKQEANKDD